MGSLDATVTPQMFNVKQREVNLIRKVFEECLKISGSEKTILDPLTEDLEPLGKITIQFKKINLKQPSNPFSLK